MSSNEDTLPKLVQVNCVTTTLGVASTVKTEEVDVSNSPVDSTHEIVKLPVERLFTPMSLGEVTFIVKAVPVRVVL